MVNLGSLLCFRFWKITFSIPIFCPLYFYKQNKTFKFPNFFLGQGRVQAQSYSILGRRNPLPVLVPLGADRSFIIGTEMV